MAESIQSLMNESCVSSVPRDAESLFDSVQIKTEIEETSSWQQNNSTMPHTGFPSTGSSANNTFNTSNMYSNPFFYQNFQNANGYPQSLSMDLYNFYHQPFLPNFNMPPVGSTPNPSDPPIDSNRNSNPPLIEKPTLKVPQFNYYNGAACQNDLTTNNANRNFVKPEGYQTNQLPSVNLESTPPVNCNPMLSDSSLSSPSVHSDHSEPTLKCWKCDLSFYCERDMNAHSVSCFGTGNNQPPQLPKTINKTIDNEAKSKYTCDECSYSCQSPAILKIHSRTHSGEKPFGCNYCEYKSGQKNNVTKHILVHMKEKPFRCQFCEYRCAQKNNLVIHERTHTGEKPFACTFCEYKTVQKPNLVKHMYLHTNQKPFVCEICNYRCVQKTNLMKHMQKHTMEKPFECGECDYRTSQKANLQKHQFSHGKEKPLQCDLCPYKCIQKCNLEKHKQSKHQSSKSPEAEHLGSLFLEKDYGVKNESNSLQNDFLPPD